jgi:hypothetical protein
MYGSFYLNKINMTLSSAMPNLVKGILSELSVYVDTCWEDWVPHIVDFMSF